MATGTTISFGRKVLFYAAAVAVVYAANLLVDNVFHLAFLEPAADALVAVLAYKYLEAEHVVS